MGLEGGHIGLHLRSDSTSIACHLGSMAGETGVGLLQALGSLSLEGEESTVLLGHGVADGVGGTTLLGVDLAVEAGTGSSRLAVVASKHSVQGSEAAVGPLHRLLQVGLGTLGSSTDSVEDFLLELGTGSLVLHLESIDAAGSGLAQGADHGGHLTVEHSTVLGLTALGLLHDGESTLFTLLDGSGDSTMDVVAVGLGHGTEHGTALSRLHSVGIDDASQLVDLVLLLPGGADSDGMHASKTTCEGSLGTTKGVHGIDASTGSVKLVGGTTQVVGRVATVLGHLVADLGHVHVEGVSHALHAAEGLSLVLGHEGAELLVLLDVLVVTLVTELHHAHELSMHIAVHLGLLELVTAHSVLEGSHTSVELGSLATGSGSELHETDLELGASRIDTGSSLVLGIGDVLHSLGEALVLESFLGAESSIHAGGGSLQHHVGVVTVLGHASTNLAELSSSGRSNGADLVVREVAESLVLGSCLGSELGATLLSLLGHVGHLVVEASHGLLEVLASLLRVLTDLGSIRSNVRVGLLDLGIGGRSESGEGTLLVKHSDLKAAGSSTLVLAHDLTSLGRATNGSLVTLVLELSGGSKLGLDTTHVAVQGLLGAAGIDSHLGEQSLLHGGTSSLVVCEVASHVGTDGGNVRTAASRLLGNLLLDLVEVLEKAHAPIGRVGDDHASLLHVNRLNGTGTTNVVARANDLVGTGGVAASCQHSLGITVCRDVHH